MSVATAIIDDARNYASNTYDDANDLVKKAMSHMTATYANSPDENWPAINIDEIDAGEPPVFADRYNGPINSTTAPIFEDIVKPSGDIQYIAPVDDFDRSLLWSGTIPSFNLDDFTKDAPTISTVVFPDSPDLIDIPFPEIATVDVPTFNGVTIPSFDPQVLATMPDLPLDIVDEYKATYDSSLPEMKAYIDSGMQEILNTYCPEYDDNRSRLITRINQVYDGGTGLDATFEQNIYDRGRARAEAEQNRVTEEVTNGGKNRGFFTPDGSIIAGLISAQNNAAMANAQYASETNIERAKLELDHLQFIMQLSNNIKDSAMQIAIQHAGTLLQVNAQALEHSQVVANLMVENFNMALKRFDSAMNYLSIQAQVYETEYKAALADLEVFKVEAEVAKLSNEISKTEVDLYLARVESQKVNLEVYIAQLEGINSEVKIQSLEIQAYSEEVKAYSTKVSAKSAEFGAYESALSGNETQVKIYGTEVSSYSERINAEKIKQDVQVNAANITLEYNKNLSEQYRTELEAYKTEIQGESTRFESVVKAYLSSIQAFKVGLDADNANLLAQVKTAELESNQATAQYQSTAAFRTDYASIRNESSRNLANTALAGAEVYADIASAALQAQNTMVEVIESE